MLLKDFEYPAEMNRLTTECLDWILSHNRFKAGSASVFRCIVLYFAAVPVAPREASRLRCRHVLRLLPDLARSLPFPVMSEV
jgi:hypothetical protein